MASVLTLVFLGESGILLQRVPRLYLEIFGESKIEFVRRSKLHVRAFFSKSRPILMSATEKEHTFRWTSATTT